MRQNIDKLERFLAAAAGARRVTVTALEPLEGGAVQENWRLDLAVDGGAHHGDLATVLRRDAATKLPESWDRPREFAIQRRAHAAGVCTPEPLWCCSEASVIGRPFFVTRHRPGVADRFAIVADPELAPDRLGLTHRLGAELARIHAIRPPCPPLDFLPVPEPSPARALVARYRDSIDRLDRPYPGLEQGLAWLEQHAPPLPAEGLVLCHNDFRSGNYLVDETGLTAVLDWEFAGWGDADADIGWFCARCWRSGEDHLEAGGVGGRDDFYAAYEAASGRAIARDAVAYWEVMAHVRWATIAAQQLARHGPADHLPPVLENLVALVPALERDILRMTAAA